MKTRGLIAAVAAMGGVMLAATVWADPPARPRPLTTAQMQHLRQIEQQPEHLTVREVRATYTSNKAFDEDVTRISDDFWSVAYLGGLPGTIIGLLICAAPL